MAAIGKVSAAETAARRAWCAKTRFGSREEALATARTRHRKWRRRKARPYVCHVCSGDGQEVWHLTTCSAEDRAFHRENDRRQRRRLVR